MATVIRLQLPFKLDQLTEGLGNCFPMAIIQQLRRPEIRSQLRPSLTRVLKHNTGHHLLRQNVHKFIMKSRSPRIATLRLQFEETEGVVNGDTWNQYWNRMTIDRTWVDYWFVQATAWYLQLDIWIIATSSTEASPYIEVNGNLADGEKPSGGPIVTLGTKSNSHYQSLLPIEMFHIEFQNNQPESSITTQNKFSEMQKCNSVNEIIDVNWQTFEQDQSIAKDMSKVYDSSSENGKKQRENVEIISQSTIDSDAFIYESNGEKCINIEKSSAVAPMFDQNQKYYTIRPFIYEKNGTILIFQRMSDDYIMKCPRCCMETKYIIQHMYRSTKCKIPDDNDGFKNEFQLYKHNKVKEQERIWQEASMARKRALDNEKVKEQQRKRQKASMEKKRAHDNGKVKEQQRRRQEASMEKKRVHDNENVKEQQRKRQEASMEKKRVHDNEKVKEEQVKRSKLSRAKKQLLNPEKIRADQNSRQQKHREVRSKHDRLRQFREASMYADVFICTCCQQRMFHSNVQLYTDALKIRINNSKPGHTRKCVEYEIRTYLNGKEEIYICKTCLKHMKKHKLPPMSAMNNLQLHRTDKKLEEEGLRLTELEGALIAKSIIFQKIYQLPKSRWTALKDRLINIPIKDDDIINTLEQMPRTPKDAGLIGVALKRKKEYKSAHKNQLIDPKKLYKMLDMLRNNGNRYYQFYDDFSKFQTRCKESDPVGYGVVFNDDIEDDVELMPIENKDIQDEMLTEDDSSDDKEKDDIEYEQNDPVKRYQYGYNKSLCMTNKYPEIETNEVENISLAPGEGKVPKDILTEDDWDIKAFPHLNNPDGSNGKDQNRKVRLTDQNFFIQKICNKERRFSRSAAYMYAAIGYLEKKQLQRNINLANTRGKEVINEMGEKAYMLDDGYRVLDDIKGTPRYWKKAKYEMIAKLDNLGPFQLFFTLSCADMRWEENFGSILQDKGFDVKYDVVKDDENNWDTVISAKKKEDEEYKPIKVFIEEEVNESLHELIRENVITATRYFHQRVKNFISKVVMGAKNPMHVKYYTYKVEFQDRGAGHIHGTLWLQLDKIEKLERHVDGSLNPRDEAESCDQEIQDSQIMEDDDLEKGQKNKPDKKPLFKGLENAFKKFRNNQQLNEHEVEAIINFIDEFTTVSLHENTVGREVVKIASEVNNHHHTKTCRKHDSTCRFKYPRDPSPHTLVARPCEGNSTEEIDMKLKKHQRVLQKVRDVLENEDVLDRIMGKYKKQEETKEEHLSNIELRIRELLQIAEVGYDDYLEALGTSKAGYSVVQRRDLDEININSYNPEWIRAWNGNMDIQIVLDFFAVITYVTDYYSKDETGTLEVIKAALSQTEAKDIKDKMRQVSNAFLTHRQMGEAESVYKLLPNMTLKQSNVTCQWVCLGSKEERSSRWKQVTEEMKESGRPLTKIIGHDGLWFKQQDMWSKYLRRPMKSLADICFAQFAKMYSSCSMSRSEKISDEKDNEDDIDEDAGYESDSQDKQADRYDPDNKFNYVMTFKDNHMEGPKLPEFIILNDPYPGEPRMMRKRKVPAVLRFNKPNPGNNPQKYMLSELMLYRPTDSEIDIEKVESLYNEEYNNKQKVKIVKSQVMENLEGVEEARYFIEQAKKQIDLSEIALQLDPALEQDKAECEEDGIEEHPDFVHYDPDQITIDENAPETNIYRRIEIPNDDELKEKTRSLDKYQKEVINIGVKYAKGMVKARKEGNVPPKAPLLMVHGGAGSGKSTVIKILAQWTQKLLQHEGQDTYDPCVIKTAFTGTASSNIEGQTLHASFGFAFDNNHYSLSDKARDKKRAQLKNLKTVIIDEVSMVKADMLYQLDLRLQEITEKVGIPFGGLAIFAFGDMMQLKPCMGRYICDEPINKEFQITHRMKSRWSMFDSLTLEVNHRQGKDKPYADLLNRVRVGKQTEEDIKQLNTRVRSSKHADLKKADLFIVCKRKECAKLNMEYLNLLDGQLLEMKARHHHSTQKNYTPWIESKEGAVASTSFLDELKLKLEAKIMIIHNIDTADSLTNGQLGTLKGVIKTTNGNIDKLVIKLKNKGAGKQNRQSNPHLAVRYPECVFIERTSHKYSLRKKSGDVGTTAMVIQFPVKLAFAITSHKIQGQTIASPARVVLDLNSVFEDAQAHVMLSRVQCLDQVYILRSLDESKIRTSSIGLNELERLRSISINENPLPWDRDRLTMKTNIKIASLNCNGLKSHFKDISVDNKLLKADIIHLIETSLEKNDYQQWNIPGYSSHFINVGNGKGIVTYFKSTIFRNEEDISTESMQLTKFSSTEIDVVNVYRSNTGNSVELLNNILTMVENPVKASLITGDFNICMLNHSKNRMSKGLEMLGFSQLIQQATHIKGGHIDHAYWRDREQAWTWPVVELYSPYYSDHDALLITLTSVK